MEQYRCADLLVFGAAAQYRYSSTIPVQQHNTGTAAQYQYSAVRGNVQIVIKYFVKLHYNKHGQYLWQFPENVHIAINMLAVRTARVWFRSASI